MSYASAVSETDTSHIETPRLFSSASGGRATYIVLHGRAGSPLDIVELNPGTRTRRKLRRGRRRCYRLLR